MIIFEWMNDWPLHLLVFITITFCPWPYFMATCVRGWTDKCILRLLATPRTLIFIKERSLRSSMHSFSEPLRSRASQVSNIRIPFRIMFCLIKEDRPEVSVPLSFTSTWFLNVSQPCLARARAAYRRQCKEQASLSHRQINRFSWSQDATHSIPSLYMIYDVNTSCIFCTRTHKTSQSIASHNSYRNGSSA